MSQPPREAVSSEPSRLRRFLNLCTWSADRLAIAANVTGTLFVLGLVLVVNYDIAARGLFNRPFHGAVELVQFAMVLIVFLQLPDVIRANRLTRSDGFLGFLSVRAPRAALWLQRLIDAASGVLMVLVAIAIFPVFVQMWDTQDYFGIPGVFTAPWWPIKLTIFVSAVLCAAIFGLRSLRARPKDDRDILL